MDDIYSDMRPSQPAGKAADQDIADMEFAYDPELEEDIALPAYAPIEQKKSPTPRHDDRGRRRRRRGARRRRCARAVVGWRDRASGPVLVKADDQPVKVKPENTGGTTIPNQDNKVYDTVAGGSAPVDPKQDTLVSSEEEPVDIPPPVMRRPTWRVTRRRPTPLPCPHLRRPRTASSSQRGARRRQVYGSR